MTYSCIFDIATVGYKGWIFIAPGVGFMILGLLMVRFYEILPFWPIKVTTKIKKCFAFLFLCISIFWTITSFYSTSREYRILLNASRTGAYNVVEGKVTNFQPMPYEGHQPESFSVNGKHFEYSNFVWTAAFNKTASHGGPIRQGLQVRISYVDNAIIKLEVLSGNK